MSTPLDPGQPEFADLSARIYRMCLALLGNEGDARDAAQEALSRAWSRRKKRKTHVSWWTWAGGFAVRVCHETRRAKAAAARTTPLDETTPAVVRNNLRNPRHADLNEAIMRLPDRQREVTVLRFLLGMSTSETARTLDCPTGTVKSNLHKAVAALRTLLPELESTHELLER